MVDFNALLSKPAEEFRRPPSLPAGSYFGTITEYKFDQTREKQTPYVRFTFKNLEAGPDIDSDDLQGIDVAKRSMSTDFYITEDALFRLREFLESLGIPASGRTLTEMIPESVGMSVQLDIVAEMDRRDPEAPPRNNVRKVTGRKD
jgi:hypothetical protein